MANDFKHKIRRLELENFTCFSKVELDFSLGINVFIGENGTGKTHLLKGLYFLRYASEYGSRNENSNLNELFGLRFHNNQLVRNNQDESNIIYHHDDELIEAKINFKRTNPDVSGLFSNLNTSQNSNSSKRLESIKHIFLPVQEMLSWYKGFSVLYRQRFISFDRTYLDLADALGLAEFRDKNFNGIAPLLSMIEEAIGGTVELGEDDNFYIVFKENQRRNQATVVATGINKLAQILRLIHNGSLDKNTVLFWDEPTANLNPKYIKTVAKFLQALANAGCQIFISTHDYLLTQLLSLTSEYKNDESDLPNIKFFALYHTDDGTKIETGNTLADIEHDSIVEEYAKVYDLEQQLFSETLITKA
ncbi:MAG: AAA family ATPase [Bacteroidota bacterium]